MPELRIYADSLRLIGRFLDKSGASQVEIVDHDTALAVSWQAREGETCRRSFPDHAVVSLLQAARTQRGTADPDGPCGREELLRTLGQVLDMQEVTQISIVEAPDGYRISGFSGCQPVQQLVTRSGLHLASCRAITRRGMARES